MFYAHFVLSKKGPLGKLWLAAHWEKKLSKAHIYDIDIENSVDDILNPQSKMALRTSGHLMLGVVRIHNRKAKYLLADCNEAFVKIKMAFRPGVDETGVDLPEQAAFNAITLPDVFQDFDTSLADFGDFTIPTNFTMNQSRLDEITLKEDVGTIRLPTLETDGFGDGTFDDREILRNASSFLNLPGLEGGLLQKDKSIDPLQSLDFEKDAFLNSALGDPPSVMTDAFDPPSVMPPSVMSSVIDSVAPVDSVQPPRFSENTMLGINQTNDQTTLINPNENAFILEPLEIQNKDIRLKKKRKLVIDDNIKIQAAVMKAQMEDTGDVTTQLDLAPPSKKLMIWKETGNVEKLFALPGRQATCTTVAYFYGKHLKAEVPLEYKPDETLEPMQIEDETIEQMRDSRATRAKARESKRLEEKSSIVGNAMVSPAIAFQEPPTPALVDNVSLNMDPPTPVIVDTNLQDATNHDFAVPSVQNDHDFHDDGIGAFFGDLSPGSPGSVGEPGSVPPENPADDAIFQQEIESDHEDDETAEEQEDRRWNKRTQQMVSILGRHLLSKDYVSFKAISKANNRKTAAAKFYTLLVLKKHSGVEVDQLQPFTDIIISKGSDFQSLAIKS